MNRRFLLVVFGISMLPCGFIHAADLRDLLGLNKSSSTSGLENLTQDQVTSGLKQALAKGVETAVLNLGRTNGFLRDPKVHIPLPDSLQKVENTLRAIGQTNLANEFVNTMNHAAEQAVPETASVLGDSVRQMSVADAKVILTSTNTAATDYFRRTSETNLYVKILPIVKGATGKTGVTAAYKRMTQSATGGSFGSFGKLGEVLLNKESFDIDAYVTRKTLDGLYLKIAEQEKLICENPAARTSEILQQVFGAIMKQ
jgi:hypothetical protein